jgi:COMPASS component SWD3
MPESAGGSGAAASSSSACDQFEQASVLSGHAKAVVSCKFHPRDGSQLASASADGTAKIWDVASGECRATLAGHAHGICDVAWSRSGSYLCTASDDHTLKLWVSS